MMREPITKPTRTLTNPPPSRTPAMSTPDPATETVLIGTEYISNRGEGPYRARVVGRNGGLVVLVYWRPDNPRSHRVTTDLPERYLRSRRCGWKQVTP